MRTDREPVHQPVHVCVTLSHLYVCPLNQSMLASRSLNAADKAPRARATLCRCVSTRAPGAESKGTCTGSLSIRSDGHASCEDVAPFNARRPDAEGLVALPLRGAVSGSSSTSYDRRKCLERLACHCLCEQIGKIAFRVDLEHD